ncbi:MAG: hypothetical protein EBR94_00835 [Bacteroidetes bacterium]|nr:hypothetical protein [Bacteroidota bacterium]
MEVTKQEVNALLKELLESTEKICKKYNLELSKSSAKFGDYFAWNIQAVKVKKHSSGVNLASPEAKAYQKYGYEAYDFTTGKTTKLKAKLGKKFNLRNKQYVFAGIRGGSSKYQIVCISKEKICYFADDVIPLLNKK